MPRVQNVLVAAIYVGICLNYKRIDLFGVEHSWLKYLSVNSMNEVCLTNHHFYDKESVTTKTWREIQNQDARLCDVLRMYANMFEAYFVLQEFALKMKTQVFNMTENSFIDAFKRQENL
jgi:hypothetical protein